MIPCETCGQERFTIRWKCAWCAPMTHYRARCEIADIQARYIKAYQQMRNTQAGDIKWWVTPKVGRWRRLWNWLVS